MVDCLFDLVLRPGEAEVPPVQILLTVVASVGTLAGGDEPGEVGGQVVPAEIVRQLLRLLGPGEPSAPLRSEPLAPGRSEPSAPLCTEPSAPPRAEQLASAGSSPASVHAEPVFRGAHEGAAAGSEPATSRAEPEGRRPEPLWQQVEQEELERWWAELERRVLAEEVGPVPERIPDRARDFATFVDLEPPDCDVFDTDPLGHDPGADTHARAAGGGDPREEDFSDPTRGSTDRSGSAVESGWWAVADGAVVDAAQALRKADQALAHARRLVRTASAADAADEEGWQAGAGRIDDAEDAIALLRACTDEQRRQLGHLLSATGGGGLSERPRLALTDAVSGALLALTDMPEMRRAGTCGNRACRRDPGCCTHDLTDRPGLGAPGPTDGYRPSAMLDRWVRARDRRCRFPGCRRRVPRGGELDHDRPYPAGETSATNLVGYCTSDHRRKHQAPGWQHALAADGTLTVTTPTGLVARTTPPPY
jgi:hypothetical protein